MKNYLAASVFAAMAGAAVLLPIAAAPAAAQTPGGSYLQSCTDVRAMGNRVVATCRRPDGRWARTSISNVDTCVGGIANANGRLTCGRGGRHHADRDHRRRDQGWRDDDRRGNRGHDQGWRDERRGSGHGASQAPRHRGEGRDHHPWQGR